MDGHLILVVGPSGSGKGSLISYATAQIPDIVQPISVTTRTPRPGEKDSEKYFFVTDDAFAKHVEAGDFLEWAVYGGNKYGTLKSQMLAPLAEGKTVMREVEVQGVEQLQKLIPPQNLRTIFIDAGSWDDLERRIRSRAPISEEELAKRRVRYEAELLFAAHADEVIHNYDGKLEAAQVQFLNTVNRLSK